MNKQKRLPGSAAAFLLVIALLADGAKFVLDLFFGLGIVIDPIFITPITTVIFWITLSHNNISMFSGKNWAAAWVNELVGLTPGIDAVPDWTVYTVYLILQNRAVDLAQGIIN